MTTIHFSYTDSYNNPSRGSLAFMPHRRHAANETEILPKPFTVPLLNGEAAVNLQPNSSSWVWIITEYFEGVSTSFYTTIPDRDGAMEHTELVHINPSSLPAPYDAVEPAWWAEMRQYKTTVSDTLLQSGEALTEARAAIETGRESVERTQNNASLAKAYSEQSRDYSYDAHDARDTAEQHRNDAQAAADRAASGPESAAQRSEDAADAAQGYRDETRDYRDTAQTHANNARDDAQTANTHATTATTQANIATNARNDAETFRDQARGYRDDILDGPQEAVQQAEAARDAAQGYRDEAATLKSDVEALKNSVDDAHTSVTQERSTVESYAADVQQLHDGIQDAINNQTRGFAVLENANYENDSDALRNVLFEDSTVSGTALTTDGSENITTTVEGWYSVSGNVRLGSTDNKKVQLHVIAGSTSSGTEYVYESMSSHGDGTQYLNASMAAIHLPANTSIYMRVGFAGGVVIGGGNTTALRVAYLGPAD